MFVSVCVCVFFFVGPLLTFFSLALDLGLNILPLGRWVFQASWLIFMIIM